MRPPSSPSSAVRTSASPRSSTACSGERRAVVHDRPGITARPQHRARRVDRPAVPAGRHRRLPARRRGRARGRVRRQAEIAIDGSRGRVFMVDAKTGVTDLDGAIARCAAQARATGLLVVNKVDKPGDPVDARLPPPRPRRADPDLVRERLRHRRPARRGRRRCCRPPNPSPPRTARPRRDRRPAQRRQVLDRERAARRGAHDRRARSRAPPSTRSTREWTTRRRPLRAGGHRRHPAPGAVRRGRPSSTPRCARSTRSSARTSRAWWWTPGRGVPAPGGAARRRRTRSTPAARCCCSTTSGT